MGGVCGDIAGVCVEEVADVRTVAPSRAVPRFEGRRMAGWLAKDVIRYMHMNGQT
jgi:hypothetical protein